MDLKSVEFGPKMLACTERERKFVLFYVDGLLNGEDNATEAARRAGYSDPAKRDSYGSAAIRVRAYEVMHRDRVRAAIREFGERHAETLLLPAAIAAGKLIGKPDHAEHAGMVKTVLSSALGQTLKVKVEGEITLNHTDAALEDLRALKALNVPREKLIEVFGHSGLGRYEQMLAIADRRVSRETGPVIEHEAADERD